MWISQKKTFGLFSKVLRKDFKQTVSVLEKRGGTEHSSRTECLIIGRYIPYVSLNRVHPRTSLGTN